MVVPKRIKVVRSRKIIRTPALPNRDGLIETAKVAQRSLQNADARYDNKRRAVNHARDSADLRRFREFGHNIENPRMRVLPHYTLYQTLLERLSRGRLKGKSILHLGSANGVYAQYLQERCGAKAIALDIDAKSLEEARHTRKVKRVVKATAIPPTTEPEWKQRPSGLWVSVSKKNHLPFKTSSVDYIISDHFLFANFHGYFDPPGFETTPGTLTKSEEALEDIHRVLRPNGRVIIGCTHPGEIPDLEKYVPGFRIHGFVVEQTYDAQFRPAHPAGPYYLILKKEQKRK